MAMQLLLCSIQYINYHGSSSILLATICSLTFFHTYPPCATDFLHTTSTMCQTHVHADSSPSQWIHKTHPANPTNLLPSQLYTYLPQPHTRTSPGRPGSTAPPQDKSGFSPSIIIGPSLHPYRPPIAQSARPGNVTFLLGNLWLFLVAIFGRRMGGRCRMR